MPRASVRRAAVAAALVASAAYANTLSNGLVRDDEFAIVRNAAAHEPGDLRRIFLTSSWAPPDLPTTSYRPLATWTFAVDHAVHGSALGYHLVNVLAHATVAALLVLLADALALSVRAAGLAGLLFAVHPANTEVVASAVGRADVLAAGLVLAALLAQRRLAAGGGPLAATAALVASAAALLAKEHAIALVVLLPLADLVLTDDGAPRVFLARLRGARGLLYLGLGGLVAGYLVLRVVALGDVIGAAGHGIAQIPYWLNPVAAAPATVRVLTALEVLALAIRVLVCPVWLSADYYYAHVRPVTSLAEPGALAGLLAAAFVVALGLVLWRHRTAFFWLALAVAAYLPVSNLLIPIATTFAERFLYLPCVGVCALVAMALAPPEGGRRRTIATLGAALLVAALGVRTVMRNRVWRDDSALALSAVATAPDSAHAHAYLGTVYAQRGREMEARAELERALAIYPRHTEALFNLAAHLLERGRLDEALPRLEQLVAIEPGHFGAWVDIAAIHLRQQEFAAALAAADRVVGIRSDAPNGHVMRGNALRGLGRLTEARVAFEQPLHRPPVPVDALRGFAETSLALGDVGRATLAYERLVAEVSDADAFRGLIASYRQTGREADAARIAAVAHARFPDDPSFAP